jgi:hypothetical protein
MTGAWIFAGAYCLGLLAGCSHASSTPADAGSMPDSADDSASASADSGSGDDADSSSGALSCTSYCAKMADNCIGANSQYMDTAQCEAMCAVWATGTQGDTAGNTLACRDYQAAAAALTDIHCGSAGPWAGPSSECAGDAGPCEVFCASALVRCSPAAIADAGGAIPAPYADLATCQAACKGYTETYDGSTASGYSATGPTTGDTFDCREYHLAFAWDSPTAPAVHCAHIGKSSWTCQ